MITEDKIPIEYKGREPIFMKNHIRVFVSTNHDWAVPAGLEERRFVVFDVGEAHMQDNGYFRAIIEEMENGGREAPLHYLITFDTSKVDLHIAPRTAALRDTKLSSMNSVQQFWYGCLSEGTLLNDDDAWGEVESNKFHGHYIETTNKTGQSRKSSETMLALTMKKMVRCLRKVKHTIYGRRVSYWVFPSLAECRADFNTMTGDNWEWPTDDADVEKC